MSFSKIKPLDFPTQTILHGGCSEAVKTGSIQNQEAASRLISPDNAELFHQAKSAFPQWRSGMTGSQYNSVF